MAVIRGHRAWCYLILAEVIFNTILLHLHTKAPFLKQLCVLSSSVLVLSYEGKTYFH